MQEAFHCPLNWKRLLCSSQKLEAACCSSVWALWQRSCMATSNPPTLRVTISTSFILSHVICLSKAVLLVPPMVCYEYRRSLHRFFHGAVDQFNFLIMSILPTSRASSDICCQNWMLRHPILLACRDMVLSSPQSRSSCQGFSSTWWLHKHNKCKAWPQPHTSRLSFQLVQ